jgi:hypothetical protein
MSRKMMLVGAGALPFPFRSGWDHEFESAFLHRRVCELPIPRQRKMPNSRKDTPTSAGAKHSGAAGCGLLRMHLVCPSPR